MKYTLILLLLCCGCAKPNRFNGKPDIAGYEWYGDSIFCANGKEAASVVVPVLFFSDSSQVCIYEASGAKETGCTYWRTARQAYDHLRTVLSTSAK